MNSGSLPILDAQPAVKYLWVLICIQYLWVLIFVGTTVVGDGVIGHKKLLSKTRGLVHTGYTISLEKKAAQSSTVLRIDFFS
jgi:hypothetical protein